MENLPIEILTSIFVKLHKLQKIECMCVCQQWSEIIKSRCLLETVVVRTESNTYYYKPFHSVMTHIKNNHFSGHCTRRLVLGDLKWLNVYITELSTLFPNLRSLGLNNSNFHMHLPSTSEEIISTFEKWLSQLENIYEYNASPLIPDLINHPYRFDQLVSLSVSGYTNLQVQTSVAWFKHLKNAPALKTFNVRNFFIRLDDIKTLHENAPSIITLEFTSVRFQPTENLDSRLPEPPMLEGLSIKYCLGPFSLLEPWVLYFLANYVCLHDLIFEHGDPDISEDLPEEPALNIIMALGDQIQSFRTNLEIQGYRELDELIRKNIHLNDFGFSIDQFDDFRFDGDELIRRCDMFKHLQTLEISDFNPEIVEMTREFTNLKHLTLQFPYSRHPFKAPTISLNALLIHQCPNQLESLCIHYAAVKASLDDTQVLQHFKTLKVYSGHVDDAAPEFLSKQCPHLRQLVFSGTTFSSNSINLPSHGMDLLEIFKPFLMSHVVRVIQDGDVKLYPNAFYRDMCYYPENDDFTLYTGIKPCQPRNLDKIRFLDFTFRSIRTVIINGNVTV